VEFSYYATKGKGEKGRGDSSIKYMFASNDGREGEVRDFNQIYVWFIKEGRDFKTKLLFYPSNHKIVSRFLNYSLHKKLNMKIQ